jgi:hypothetical protein
MWRLLILDYQIKAKLRRNLFNRGWKFSFSKVVVLTFVLLLSSNSLPISAQAKYSRFDEINFPIPAENQLFYLQRDPDRNTVVYKLNIKDGVLDKDDPITAFWIRYEEEGQRKELSFIQRKLAYGINSKLLKTGGHEIRLVSYPTVPLYLLKSAADNQYHIYTQIERKRAILDRIFVRIDGGSGFIPNVKYVEIAGKDADTGKSLAQRLVPSK